MSNTEKMRCSQKNISGVAEQQSVGEITEKYQFLEYSLSWFAATVHIFCMTEYQIFIGQKVKLYFMLKKL